VSPVGTGVLSLTKFYRLRELTDELAQVVPGMNAVEVRALLGAGHEELVDDLVLYRDGRVVDADPLLNASRAHARYARQLVWVALVMADHRLAGVVETILTDADGHLIGARFNTDDLERRLANVLPGQEARKPATNILSYLRDAGIVDPETHGNSIVGIHALNATAPAVPAAVEYVAFRLNHLRLPHPAAADPCAEALAVLANRWLLLSPDEFRVAYHAAIAVHPPPLPPPPPPPAFPVTTEVPVEAYNTETYEIAAHDETLGRRQEQPLVLAYKAWMEVRGSTIVRLRFRPPGVADDLYCDLYDKTRNSLIEAKADQRRSALRMAIGQLADYARYAPVPPPERAVLTPRRLHPDLEALLETVGIASIWRSADRFYDNAGGRFT
jgi:hypothetical protein